MPHTSGAAAKRNRNSGGKKARTAIRSKLEPRYNVGLPADLARQVEEYAEVADTSVSKAIATLVRLGIESRPQRKRAFLKKLRANLANENPRQQDRMADEFRALILGQ
jgi:hypothetical protein